MLVGEVGSLAAIVVSAVVLAGGGDFFQCPVCWNNSSRKDNRHNPQKPEAKSAAVVFRLAECKQQILRLRAMRSG